MLFKDENVSPLLRGLNFQMFLCLGSGEGCMTGSRLMSRQFIKCQRLVYDSQGKCCFPSPEGGTLLLGWPEQSISRAVGEDK